MIDPTDVGGPPAPRPAEPVRPPAVPPARPAWFYPFLAVCAFVLTGTAIFLAVQYYRPGPGPEPPAPVADYDPAFVPIGKRYAAQVGLDWAKSNEDIAKLHDAGQSRQAANDTGAERFKALRMQSYRDIVSLELEKLVAKDKKDAELTIDDHKKLARAHRGLLKGGGGR